MSPKIKSVCHISFIVKDINKTVKNWASFLDIEIPEISFIPKIEEAPTLSNGILEDCSDCLISVIEMENIVIEFVQPGQKDTPWRRWLDENGEGFQHVAFVVEDREKAKEKIRETLGVDDWYHIGYYPNGAYAFYDTKEALATELNIKDNQDNKAIITELLEKKR